MRWGEPDLGEVRRQQAIDLGEGQTNEDDATWRWMPLVSPGNVEEAQARGHGGQRTQKVMASSTCSAAHLAIGQGIKVDGVLQEDHRLAGHVDSCHARTTRT